MRWKRLHLNQKSIYPAPRILQIWCWHNRPLNHINRLGAHSLSRCNRQDSTKYWTVRWWLQCFRTKISYQRNGISREPVVTRLLVSLHLSYVGRRVGEFEIHESKSIVPAQTCTAPKLYESLHYLRNTHRKLRLSKYGTYKSRPVERTEKRAVPKYPPVFPRYSHSSGASVGTADIV